MKKNPCENPIVFWLTGLSGSGKSTIATALHQKLNALGILSQWVDGDVLRNGLCNDLGYSLNDRKENIRRVAEVVKILMSSGVIPIVSLISPMLEDRAMAKKIIGSANFFEIYISTPLEVCEARDPKGLYQQARSGKVKNFTGLSSPYEAPTNPSLEIDTSQFTIDTAIEKILKLSLPIMLKQ